MYISKRGPQFVLVATLLAMLSPVRCAHMHPHLSERDGDPLAASSRATRSLKSSPDGKTMTYVRLFNYRHQSYVSLRKGKRGRVRVESKCQNQDSYSLLRLESSTNSSQSFTINIYNEKSQRYICFDRSGRVRTTNTTSTPGLRCDFFERVHTSKCRGKVFYEADEGCSLGQNRVLSFCGHQKKWRATLQQRRGCSKCHTFSKQIKDSVAANRVVGGAALWARRKKPERGRPAAAVAQQPRHRPSRRHRRRNRRHRHGRRQQQRGGRRCRWRRPGRP